MWGKCAVIVIYYAVLHAVFLIIYILILMLLVYKGHLLFTEIIA